MELNNLLRGGALALILAIALALPAQCKVSMTLCDICGRFWDDSPARMKAVVDLGHGHSRTLYGCSPFCLLERMEDYKDKPVSPAMVVLYDTYKDSDALMTVAERSTFLVDIEGDEQKNSAPYIAAFRNEKAAKQAQKDLGGRVLDWAKLKDEVSELTEEWEPKAPKDYPPLRPERKPK